MVQIDNGSCSTCTQQPDGRNYKGIKSSLRHQVTTYDGCIDYLLAEYMNTQEYGMNYMGVVTPMLIGTRSRNQTMRIVQVIIVMATLIQCSKMLAVTMAIPVVGIN